MAPRIPRVADEVDEQLSVDYLLSAPALVRNAFVASMEGQEVDPQTVEEATVVLSELVTNSVQHSAAPVGDQLRAHWTLRRGVVEVDVTDAGGPSRPVPARRHVLAPSGRGLRIVRSLAHEWGVVDGPGWRTVWAALGGPSRRRTR